MRRPVFLPTPRRIISSSRHSVPSKKTSAAPLRRCDRAGVIAAQPGMKKNRAPVAGSATSRPIVRPSSWMPGSRPGSSSQSATLPGTAKAVTASVVPPETASSVGFSRRRTRCSTQSGASTEKLELAASTACPSAVAHSANGWRSRIVKSPATASTSPPVRTTPPIGEERSPCRGHKHSVAPIWARRSGEAFSRNQLSPSTETAKDAWVRDFAATSPARARRQAGVFEFHWGKPPPAAEPSTTTRPAASPGSCAGEKSCYFTLAQAYELISVPTAISTILGFFQAMVSSEDLIATHHYYSRDLANCESIRRVQKVFSVRVSYDFSLISPTANFCNKPNWPHVA